MNMMQALNIVIQSFFNLLTPIGLSLLISWLLVEKAGAPGWIYALLVFFGVGVGFYSMIRFLLTALAALERLEKEQGERDKRRKK
ncbi:MAG: AtpZ/AtpI family protein [Clostridia bacterium]|nr:AtpZ/AtpI family protein [Clostridia bacterium]